ncbi:MAG TPA: hypothetical protein VGG03_20625 [Thermoanaerobaculia bacterium]|jgi:tetratricopeptide (TPR) repeat protein
MSRIHPKPAARILAWRPSAAEYGPVIDSVLAAFRPRILAAARERAEAPFLLSELLRQAPERRELLVRNSRRFLSFALCGLLLERSCQESAAAPRQGERLAALALVVADSLDPAWYGDRLLADARARCCALIADARRVAGDLPGAEEALQAAESHLRQGMGDPLERARLLAFKAALLRAQRRSGEAASLFRRADARVDPQEDPSAGGSCA